MDFSSMNVLLLVKRSLLFYGSQRLTICKKMRREYVIPNNADFASSICISTYICNRLDKKERQLALLQFITLILVLELNVQHT